MKPAKRTILAFLTPIIGLCLLSGCASSTQVGMKVRAAQRRPVGQGVPGEDAGPRE